MKSKTGKKRRYLTSGGIALVMATALAAAVYTGNGAATTPSTRASAGATTDSPSTGISLAKFLNGTVTFPNFTPTKFHPGHHKVGIVALGLQDAQQALNVPYLMAAVKAMGWSAKQPYDAKFQPSVAAGIVQQLVIDKVDVIMLLGIAPAMIPSAVANATGAKIPIVCIYCYPATKTPGVTYIGYGAGKQVADVNITYVLQRVVQNIAKPKLLVIRNPDLPLAISITNAELAMLKKYCSRCEVSTVSMSIADATAPGMPAVSAVLQQHPKGTVDAIITPFDLFASSFIQVGAQLGRSDFKIVGFSGAPPFIDAVKRGDPLAGADPLVPAGFTMWGAVDLAGRIVAGARKWNSFEVPIALVTPGNAKKIFAGTDTWKPPFNYQARFKAAWMLGS